MAKPRLPDDLRAVLRPVLRAREPGPEGGQPRLDDRKAPLGIPFALRTGVAWEDLPCELGCGSGMTCWRRLAEWQADGTWDGVHAAPLARLRAAGKIDRPRAAVDSSSARAAFAGARRAGPRRIAGRRGPGTTCW